ncbi:MAG: 1-(5-phosphoribosyl)-5-[(5-phosphoribosylamino)methylideneamino]imidazole-4-carboxamide isomerase [Candidatus Lokiarchaeota archaeon]|nr:1-(5-phosphoribosyl)-5-[(5-phosphoribosylamino)methylideneamino]imidazole-4-carboxamide isomerase [Candidatus Lokiarchaeota archaeon]
MLIIPAIDLQNGKCVRLFKGKMDKKTIYYEDPLVPARKFLDLGVKVLHIVDLDGAYGKGHNLQIMKKIINELPMKIQVGGGIRSVEKAEELYNLGVERVICGTAAIKYPKFVINVVDRIGSKHLMVALDHRKGKLLTHGWQENSNLDVFQIGKEMEKKGAGFILFSSAEVDGTLLGPDVKNTSKMIESVNIPVIAAGGISKLEDIFKIKEIDAYGLVIGKAIYEGMIKLEEALRM